jgi:hypothetical protein
MLEGALSVLKVEVIRTSVWDLVEALVVSTVRPSLEDGFC